MKKNLHIIQQQSIEIGFAGIDDGIGMQDRIAEIFYTGLQPKMNSMFEEMANEKCLVSVERLEIDCGELPDKNWEDALVDITLRKLKAELLTKHKKDLPGELNNEAADALLYFLEHGRLPWNVLADSLKEIERSITINSSFISKLKVLIVRKPEVVTRLLKGLSASFKDELVDAFVRQSNKEWKSIRSIYEQDDNYGKSELQKTIFEQFRRTPSQDALIKIEEEVVAGAKLKIDHRDLENSNMKKSKIEKIDESVYVRNAGLVLLHPFLPQLFEITGIYNENNWVDEIAQPKAVKILEYLSTGINKFEEINFVFNKVLCGLDPSAYAGDKEPLDEATMSACDLLLKEVIGHWHQLKNTGIEAFRETFLQRSGKLTAVDNGWTLQVEQHTIDILIDSLPWGIGIIKLPWMQEMVYTEWK